jgi:hypothetical protein
LGAALVWGVKFRVTSKSNVVSLTGGARDCINN